MRGNRLRLLTIGLAGGWRSQELCGQRLRRLAPPQLQDTGRRSVPARFQFQSPVPTLRVWEEHAVVCSLPVQRLRRTYLHLFCNTPVQGQFEGGLT